MKNNKIENCNLHVPISMLGENWKGSFNKLLPNKTYKVVIDYPVEYPLSFDIKSGKNGMGMVALLNKIGKLYEKIYLNEDKYRVCNHDIDDLNLSGLKVNHEKLIINLYVDS